MIRRRLLGIAVILLAALPAVMVYGSAWAQSVSQSYGADSQISPGIIVKLQDKDASKVEPLTEDSINKMLGVVVDANAAPVTLSNGTPKGIQVYVVTSGTFEVLVSNQNGVIHAGDYITISSLEGTGMKAGTAQTTVLGKATAGFDGKSGVLNTTTLKNSIGDQVNVAIGRIPVTVTVGRNPNLQINQPNLPGFLARASQNIANKPVSTARVYLSVAALLVSAIIAGSLLYAGVRSSLVAVGRNPLAKKSIVRSLVQVTLTSLIVFIIGLFAVYLLLKL